jgi:polyhydroxyalkanoate synthesis repressor PhaR
MGESRVIKRYANRKLYDTQRSRYVTLDQIADMVRGGDDVKIVDNNSKEDLTTVTLAQIIFEEEKKQKSFLPLNAMKNIIQSGGERIEELVSQAQRKVSGVFSRKPGGEKANGESESPPPIEAADVVAPREASSALHEFREWIESSQQKITDWQKSIDDRIRHLVEGISPFASLQKDFAALSLRLAEVEQQVARLQQHAGVSAAVEAAVPAERSGAAEAEAATAKAATDEAATDEAATDEAASDVQKSSEIASE